MGAKTRIFLTVVLVLILIIKSNAQNALDNAGLSGNTNASVAYSLRKLSSNYSGPLVRILIGNSFYDVYPDSSANLSFSLSSQISASYSNYNDAKTGATATLLSSIVSGSTSARVAIWYDQSGNAIDVMTSSTNGPILISSGAIQTMNGLPTIYFAGVIQGTTHLLSAATVNFTSQTAATINAVVQNVGSLNYISGILSTGNSGGWGLIYDPNNMGYWIDGSGCTNATSSDILNDSKIVTGVIDLNAATSSIYENGVVKQTRNSICQIAHSPSDNICIGIRAADGGARIFDGYISEVILFPSYLNSTDRTALETSQNTAYFSPSVSITSSALNNSACLGTSVTFTATSSNATNPSFQWYKNGTAINGATGTTYTTTSLVNNDVINVAMTVVTNNGNVISSGLIQYLNANDSSSYNGSGTTWNDIINNNDGTVNPATFNTLNGYSYFDLNNEVIPAPVTKSSSMTFSVWAKTTNPQGMLFNSGSDGSGPDLFFDNNQICWNVWDSFSSPFNVSTSIIDTNWHNYTVVVDAASNSSKLYFDGVLEGTGPYHISSSTDLFIGAAGSGGGYYWNGYVSSFQTYNRALTAAEVLSNYNVLNGIATYSSNSISMSLSVGAINSTAVKLSTGATSVISLPSSSSWYVVTGGNDNHALFQITSGHELSFINPMNYTNGQNNTYLVTATTGCQTRNLTVSISPFCGTWQTQGNNGLSQSNPGESAYQIKRDYPNSTDGLYWIANQNINSNIPFQIYADMTTNGGGWTLIMCSNSNSGWTGANAILWNENNPTLNGQYSIISYADYIKKSTTGFQYMIDATSRRSYGGIWTANQAYSFTSNSSGNTDITENVKFSNWDYGCDDVEFRMPWHNPGGPGFITTDGSCGGWWGTLITDGGWSPAPWMANYNSNPGIIWYWVR
ncbi:LamG-like jellyroll fold domain-containing protein [Flavobacterium sp.]|uniref:LamG-like jellyroll fold domain-containing protein n=1 Tax=Flavobacterium sp. TaxID=239 RepID=UPI0033406058